MADRVEKALFDSIRELEKCHDVLRSCDEYFHHQASMNARLHMSDKVIPNPLASAVATQVRGLDESISRLMRVAHGEVPLPGMEEEE